MRVLQLIDSLRPGGAERMAVNYANALAKRVDASHLCCTRMEGMLRSQLSPGVGYLFLKKRHFLDLQAFFQLRRYIRKNRINLIQAHSSSWFLAGLMKMSLPGIKLVWHDHYGRDLFTRKPGVLLEFSRYFDGVLSVNEALKEWARVNLKVSEVRFIRNFLPKINSDGRGHIFLRGENDFRLICVANFRPQKDHLNLLMAFERIMQTEPAVSLHLIGKDEKDAYSDEIKNYIRKSGLEERVFVYGEQQNPEKFLEQADLGVLSSASEGLPLALLEYGRADLPVICTQVGECPEVIGGNGRLVRPGDPVALAEELVFYIRNREKRETDAKAFHQKVMQEFSEEAVIPQVLQFFEDLRR